MVEIFVLLFQQRAEIFQRRHFQLLGELRQTRRHVAFQRLATFVQVFVLFGLFVEGDVRQFFDVSIGNRHVETIAEVVNPFHVHFLHLVSDVLPSAVSPMP